MTDRQKVIRALECCSQLDIDDICPAECPYAQDVCCGTVQLMADALELLKEQEPRVLTLEEVHEMAWDYCYLEEEVIKDKVLQIYTGKYRIKCITWPSIASCVLTFGDDAYGKRWRCWTSRPTDEQRKAVKWDGDEH